MPNFFLAQPYLRSGQNIKTVAGESLLGPGDVDVVTNEDLQAAIEDVVTSPVTKLEPLFWDRLANEVPCCETIPNAATYAPLYLAELTGSVNGSTFTVSGGDTITDFGTGTWAAVLVIGQDYHNCIAVSRSGSTVTITPPSPSNGAASLMLRHGDILGQHLNEPGGRAMARALYNGTWEPLSCILRLSPRHVHGAQSPSYWQVFNGAPANQLLNRVARNLFTLDGTIVQRASTRVTLAAASNTQGVFMDITLDAATDGFVQVYLGHEGPLGSQVNVSLLVDDVVVSSGTNYGYLQCHKLQFSRAKKLRVRIVSAYAGGSLTFRIGDVSVHSKDNTRRFLRPKEKLLVVGDSWITATYPGLVEGLQDLHDGDVVRAAVGGTTASYHLEVVDGVRRIDALLNQHNPDVCLIHSYINDQNQSVSLRTWWSNILEICKACTDKGVQPFAVLPGITSSLSQTQLLQISYGYAAETPQRLQYPVEVKSLDMSSALSSINQIAKVPGRAVKDTEALKVYIASGKNPSDAWLDAQSPTNVVIPKTFENALVLLTDMIRFYGCATQSSSTLDDSSSTNIDGTASASLIYDLDIFGIGRNYFSLDGSEWVDCGASGALSSTGDWTVGAWARVPVISGNYAIFAQGIGPSATGVSIAGGKAVVYMGSGGSQPGAAAEGGTIVANKWHHVVGRRASNVFTIWLDGVLVGTRTDSDATRTIQSGGNLIGAVGFGAYNTNTLYRFNGDLADVFVANSALSDAKIAWMASNQNYII